jgi:hypothetical protein
MKLVVWRRIGLPRGQYQKIQITAHDLVKALGPIELIEILSKQKRKITMASDDAIAMIWDELMKYHNPSNKWKTDHRMPFYHPDYSIPGDGYTDAGLLMFVFKLKVQDEYCFRKTNIKIDQYYKYCNPDNRQTEFVEYYQQTQVQVEPTVDRYINFLRYLAKK